MNVTGTFPNGVINGQGEVCHEFVLNERTFRHSLELANDRNIDKELLVDPVYYDAAIIAKRLSVPGLDRLTPEMVLDLEGEDGDALAQAIMTLDQRRSEFRSAAPAAPKTTDRTGQAGDPLDLCT